MDHSDLPPEILARAFEFGIHAWGIQILRPLSQVCRYWQEIIETTPRLWGIIIVKNTSSIQSLESQIIKAKASPLSVSLLLGCFNRRLEPVVNRLISLSYNWIYADMTTSAIARCRWANLRTNLEELHLSRGRPVDDDPRDFFDDTVAVQLRSEIKLRSFTAVGLPKSWVLRFLGPSIRHFCFRLGRDEDSQSPTHSRLHSICNTLQYLSRINEAVIIELENLNHSNFGRHTLKVTHFNNLQTLRLSMVLYTSTILCSMSAPSLQTLIVDRTPEVGFVANSGFLFMTPFFSQWSQPGFIPLNLHTLELVSCLQATDVPFLIRWLARLPNIVRLIFKDDAIGLAAATLGQDTDDANLYKALAFPTSSAMNGWLCPSLMILHIETDEVVADLIPIARARGGIASPDLGIPPPSRLRRIEAMLCSTSEPGERELLDSLVDHATCICISCGLALELVV
ncbi:hypothetical protein BYT27DRAFT_7194793 [Phlegmacium glaucopus]|nr:hypothetical protein BYT27DRAFT_7194793 [Phlegmacium glaucopus]